MTIRAFSIDAARRPDGTVPVLHLVGAGDLGRMALSAAARRGLSVAAFFDGRREKAGRQIGGIEVRSMDRLSELPRDAVIVLCHNHLLTAEAEFADLGFDNLFACVGLVSADDDAPVPDGVEPLEGYRKAEWHEREFRKLDDRQSGRLHLKYVDVVVTEACSMKCQDCSNLMQYYQRVRNADTEVLLRSIDRLSDCSDRIGEMRIIGGEPFINKQCGAIVEHVKAKANVDSIVVYTNATLVPGQETLDALADERVIVSITDYGPELSKRLDALVAACEARGIAHLVKIPEWTDSGRIQYRRRTRAENDRLFRNCCVNDILTLLHGRLYRCPFTANATNLGAVPERADEIVELAGEDFRRDEARDRIAKVYMRETSILACQFCNGRDFSTPRIEAAIQTRTPLALPKVPAEAV